MAQSWPRRGPAALGQGEVRRVSLIGSDCPGQDLRKPSSLEPAHHQTRYPAHIWHFPPCIDTVLSWQALAHRPPSPNNSLAILPERGTTNRKLAWCWPGVLKLHSSALSCFRGCSMLKFWKNYFCMETCAIMASTRGLGSKDSFIDSFLFSSGSRPGKVRQILQLASARRPRLRPGPAAPGGA